MNHWGHLAVTGIPVSYLCLDREHRLAEPFTRGMTNDTPFTIHSILWIDELKQIYSSQKLQHNIAHSLICNTDVFLYNFKLGKFLFKKSYVRHLVFLKSSFTGILFIFLFSDLYSHFDSLNKIYY